MQVFFLFVFLDSAHESLQDSFQPSFQGTSKKWRPLSLLAFGVFPSSF